MRKKILITAFEPFAGRKTNPALEVMARLAPGAFPGCALRKARLPVSGKAVGRKIATLTRAVRPDCIVSLGLAAGEAAVRVERFALNIQDYGIRDNAGYRPEGVKIWNEGPAAYFVNSDPAATAAAVRAAGVPAYVSNHAGAYVCNHLMYEAMRAVEAGGNSTSFAFIHLPLTTEMALKESRGRGIPPSLPLALLVKAVEAAIKALS